MEAPDPHKLVGVRMPCGQPPGRLLADLPGAYLAWFARKGLPEGELGRLPALMLELHHHGLTPLLHPLRQRRQAHAGQLRASAHHCECRGPALRMGSTTRRRRSPSTTGACSTLC